MLLVMILSKRHQFLPYVSIIGETIKRETRSVTAPIVMRRGRVY